MSNLVVNFYLFPRSLLIELLQHLVFSYRKVKLTIVIGIPTICTICYILSNGYWKSTQGICTGAKIFGDFLVKWRPRHTEEEFSGIFWIFWWNLNKFVYQFLFFKQWKKFSSNQKMLKRTVNFFKQWKKFSSNQKMSETSVMSVSSNNEKNLPKSIFFFWYSKGWNKINPARTKT